MLRCRRQNRRTHAVAIFTHFRLVTHHKLDSELRMGANTYTVKKRTNLIMVTLQSVRIIDISLFFKVKKKKKERKKRKKREQKQTNK